MSERGECEACGAEGTVHVVRGGTTAGSLFGLPEGETRRVCSSCHPSAVATDGGREFTANPVTCPECGVSLRNDECPNCGWSVDEGDE